MINTIVSRVGVLGAFGIGLAVCAGLAAGVAEAQADDLEMACIAALAEEANVDMASISSTGAEAAGEGTVVSLSLDGAPWNCSVNDAGEVTQLEFQGEG